jgi:hypothetical protein
MAKQLVRFIKDQLRWAEWKYPWLRDGEIPSDPLKDLTTANNELSTYEFEDEESFYRIASAYAYTRNNHEKLDYIIFSTDSLEELRIKKNKSLGETKDSIVNVKHHDLIELSAEDVLVVAHHLIQNGELGRILEEHLFKEIYKSISKGWLTGSPNKYVAEGLRKWTDWIGSTAN